MRSANWYSKGSVTPSGMTEPADKLPRDLVSPQAAAASASTKITTLPTTSLCRSGLTQQLRTMVAGKTARKQRGRPFRKGQSGNPQGRPLGTRNRATIAAEALLDGEAEAITRKVVERAKEERERTLLKAGADNWAKLEKLLRGRR
jgi:hypothetical protein